MPIYNFKCPVCGHEQEEILQIRERNDLILCRICGCVTHRSYMTKSKRHAEAKPFWSNTMGVHPDQVAEERKAHPDWKIRDDGRVLVEGLADQRRKCKELGMVNYDDNV